mgnify:CR=1 FL=1
MGTRYVVDGSAREIFGWLPGSGGADRGREGFGCPCCDVPWRVSVFLLALPAQLAFVLHCGQVATGGGGSRTVMAGTWNSRGFPP